MKDIEVNGMEQSATMASLPRRRRRRRDGQRVSQVLRGLAARHPEPRITVWQLRDALGDRAFGVLLFAFAVPNLMPLPPGVSTIFAIPILLISAQFVFGARVPYFPAWLGNRSFAKVDFQTALERIRPSLRWAERLLQPRLLWVTSSWGERFVGLFCVALALVMCLPIPFGHWLPAFSICVMALALVERDGLVLLLGVGIGVISLVIIWAVLEAMVRGAYFFFTRTLHL